MSKISQLATELSKELDKRAKTKTDFDEQEQAALLSVVNTLDDAGMIDIDEPDDEDWDDSDEDEPDEPEPDFGEDDED